MNDAEEAAAVQAALEALGDDATAEQILQATAGFREGPVTAALRRLAASGGSLPDPAGAEPGQLPGVNAASDGFELVDRAVVHTPTENDAASYVVLDSAGVTRAEVSLDSSGLATVRVRDPLQQAEAKFSVGEGGEASFYVQNADASVWLSYYAATGVCEFWLVGLPTVNPAAAGQVWNDAGTLKVSAG